MAKGLHPSRKFTKRFPSVTIGSIGIMPYAGGKVWLFNSAGEGMATTVTKLEATLKRFFKREF